MSLGKTPGYSPTPELEVAALNLQLGTLRRSLLKDPSKASEIQAQIQAIQAKLDAKVAAIVLAKEAPSLDATPAKSRGFFGKAVAGIL